MATAEEFFNVSNPELQTQLTKYYDEVEAAIVAARPSLKGQIKYMSTLPMHVLDIKTRTEFTRRFRDIVSLDDALGHLANVTTAEAAKFPGLEFPDRVPTSSRKEITSRASRIYSALRTPRSATGERPFGRLPATSGSLLSRIYSNLNLQFRTSIMPDRSGITPVKSAAGEVSLPGLRGSSYFTVGLNSIPSRQILRTSAPDAVDLAGKSRLIFDIETAGFDFGSIREVAYSTINADNRIKTNRLAFDTDQFNRGRIRYDDRALSLNDFLKQKFGLSTPTKGKDDFARGMIPFLKELQNTDLVVGHNISGFDIEQVFVGLSRTKLYQRDREFAKLVDTTYDQLAPKVVDTLEMARNMNGLRELSVAKELAVRGQQTQYSIANLLLQTDLPEYIEGGPQRLIELMGDKGLHHAEIDVEVTDAILKANQNGGLQVRKGKNAVLTSSELRQRIASSSAITPFTNLTDVDQIDRGLLKKLIDDYNNKGILRASRGGELDDLLRNNKKEAYRRLTTTGEDKLAPTSIRMTALEQQILMERNLAQGIADKSFSAPNVINQIGAIRAKRNTSIPLNILSEEEKSLAYGISQATSSLSSMSDKAQKTARLAEDTLVSRFDLFDSRAMQYSTRTGRPTLPVQLLKAAGIDTKFVSLSIVDPTFESPHGAVNVVQNLDDNEFRRLQRLLAPSSSKGKGILDDDVKLSAALGLDSEADNAARLRDFRKAVEGGLLDKVKQRGATIGQVFDGPNRGVSENVADIFRRFFIVRGQLRDEDMGRVLLPVMDIGNGQIRTAGAVVNKGMSSQEIQGLSRAVEGTRNLYSQYQKLVDEGGINYFVARAAKAGADSDTAMRAYRLASEKIIPNLGKGISGLAAAGIGAVLFNRYRENQELNETLDFQGHESSAAGQYGIYDQIQQRMASGYDGYAQNYDPLATASVTNNLNTMKQGHSFYNWDRNNAIYGGVL